MTARARRSATVLALLATALASGVVVAVVGGTFIWAVEHGTDLVWVRLPEHLGVRPFTWWWIAAVASVGGAMVGLLQRTIGDHPRPLEEALAAWRSGGRVEPATVPRTAVNSLVVLVMGGPVGFEAALVGLLGGTAAFIAERIRSAGSLLRQVWGAERIDAMPRALRRSPYWLAAAASVVAYRAMPFGRIDLGFRFDPFDGGWGIADALAVAGFAVVVAVPTALALRVVAQAERSTLHQRAPVGAAVAGGLGFALLAMVDRTILFSGQTEFQHLPTLSDGHLLYITVAKWLALVIALRAGWRGGPIFPLYTAVGALAVVVAGAVGTPADLLMVSAVAAVSTVITNGKVLLACVLTVYVVPLSFVAVIALGSSGAALALAAARPLLAPRD